MLIADDARNLEPRTFIDGWLFEAEEFDLEGVSFPRTGRYMD